MGDLNALQIGLMVSLVVIFAIVIFHKPLGKLAGVAARTGVGLLFLALFSHVGNLFGITLGVNLLNALVLGVLGVPGFGLLLMLHWVLPG
jgi:inhibitor of the pro-sigma K processing machinery